MHYADWAPRGWHQAAVFMGRLFVLGGSPLNNDVWSANITNATGNRYSGTADSKLNAGERAGVGEVVEMNNRITKQGN